MGAYLPDVIIYSQFHIISTSERVLILWEVEFRHFPWESLVAVNTVLQAVIVGLKLS